MSAVTILVSSTGISRHKRLLINDSRDREKTLVEVRVVGDATVDQSDRHTRARIVRLPREVGIHRGRSAAQGRRKRAVSADVHHVGLVRQAHNPIAVEHCHDAVHKGQLP